MRLAAQVNAALIAFPERRIPVDTKYKLGVIGAGMMGSALVRGALNQGLFQASEIIMSDALPAALQCASENLGVQTTTDNQALVTASAVVLLAVKPQVLAAVVDQLRWRPDQLVISIAAGVPLARLNALVGEGQPVVRVMPNILAVVGQASSAYAANRQVTPEQLEFASALLSAAGVAVAVEERLLDAVTGLSGSAPAFVALFAEALTDGGVAAGLPRADAAKLTAQTIRGVGEWLLATGNPPALLKDMVTSPGGTTIAGVRALEAGGLRSASIEAVVAAAERSRELGK